VFWIDPANGAGYAFPLLLEAGMARQRVLYSFAIIQASVAILLSLSFDFSSMGSTLIHRVWDSGFLPICPLALSSFVDCILGRFD